MVVDYSLLALWNGLIMGMILFCTTLRLKIEYFRYSIVVIDRLFALAIPI